MRPDIIQAYQELPEDLICCELGACGSTDCLAVRALDLVNRFKVGRQRGLVTIVGHVPAAGRQPFDKVAGRPMLDESRAGANADGRAASKKDLLQGQRAVVVVGQVSAGP